MSTFRKIWADSLLASQQLCFNRGAGEFSFVQLLRQHPDDGMIYYARAEAYEYLNELALAKADYLTAETLFPLSHWKAVAREGVNRAQSKVQGTNTPQASSIIVDVFHRVHSVPALPHEVRVDALSAIPKFDSEPHFTATQLRSSVEKLVTIILDVASISYTRSTPLSSRIRKLESIAPKGIVDQMHTVRELGNAGVHGDSRDTDNFRPTLHAFAEIAEWFGSSQYSRRPST